MAREMSGNKGVARQNEERGNGHLIKLKVGLWDAVTDTHHAQEPSGCAILEPLHTGERPTTTVGAESIVIPSAKTVRSQNPSWGWGIVATQLAPLSTPVPLDTSAIAIALPPPPVARPRL